MNTCVFCKEPALYVYSTAPGDASPFCEVHLPHALYSLRDSGGLATTAEYAAIKQATIDKLSGVVEEPTKPSRKDKVVVEDSAVATEEPAPSE